MSRKMYARRVSKDFLLQVQKGAELLGISQTAFLEMSVGIASSVTINALAHDEARKRVMTQNSEGEGIPHA